MTDLTAYNLYSTNQVHRSQITLKPKAQGVM